MHRASSRRLEGNLCDVSVNRLLEICAYRQVTGTLRIDSWGRSGVIGLERGQVCDAAFHDLGGERAMDELVTVRDGMFVLRSDAPVSLDAPIPTPWGEDGVEELADADVIPVEEPAPPLPVPPQSGPRPDPAATPWPQPAMQPGAPSMWAQRDWTPPQAQAGWPPQYAIVEPVPVVTRRFPTVTPAVGIGLFCLTVIFSVVAIQL